MQGLRVETGSCTRWPAEPCLNQLLLPLLATHSVQLVRVFEEVQGLRGEVETGPRTIWPAEPCLDQLLLPTHTVAAYSVQLVSGFEELALQGLRVEVETGPRTIWPAEPYVDQLLLPLLASASLKLPSQLLLASQTSASQRCTGAYSAVKVGIVPASCCRECLTTRTGGVARCMCLSVLPTGALLGLQE